MKFKNIFFTSVIALLFSVIGFSQSPTQLRKKCPNVSLYSILQITSLGDINVQPCTGRTTIFTQNITLPSGVTSSGLTGSPNLAFKASAYVFSDLPNTAEFDVRFTPSSTVGSSAIGDCSTTPTVCLSQSQAAVTSSLSTGTGSTFAQTATTAILTTSGAQVFNGLTFGINNATANGQFIFSMLPSVSAGSLSTGDCITTPTSCLSLSQSANTSSLIGSVVNLGDLNVTGNGTGLNVTDGTKTIAVIATGNTAVLDLGGVINNKLNRTVTAGGTVGAQTINKPAGTVNFAAAAASLVVTNSQVTASSIINTTIRTADATCTFVKSTVAGVGSFTITMNAACGAETSVGFIVWN